MHPSFCLNMIVKNEGKIIKRLFDSVIPIIDCYCICDTGSTDNTVDIIREYFEEKNIPGQIFSEPFVNFSHNRNVSLQKCVGMSDYILLMDADMIAKIDKDKINFIKQYIYAGNFDIVHILQGSENFYYKNVRIIKNDFVNNPCKYIGSTHEYISFNSNKIYCIDKNLFFIEDIGDGANKSCKFKRDVDLLTNDLISNPNNERSCFYLANSYHDLGEYDNAIEMYKKRISLGGWKEEVWYSYYKIGLCYKNLKKYDESIIAFLNCVDYYPERLEGLYEIINYYRMNGKNKLAFHFYNIAKSILINTTENDRSGYLFLHNNIYTYELFYEYSIIAFYNGIKNINDEIMRVFNNSLEYSMNSNVMSNLKFYNTCLTCKRSVIFDDKFTHENSNEFYSSSSCLVKQLNTDNYLINVRYVNYFIGEDGKYKCDGKITSLNKCLLLDKKFNTIESHMLIDVNVEDQCRYAGIEDMKIYYADDNNLLFIGSKFDMNKNNIGISCGNYNDPNNTLIPTQLTINYANYTNNVCEKNWVFTKYNNKTHIIYKWHPLTICNFNINDEVIEIVDEKQMPLFFSHIRGSTCGFNHVDKIKNINELWFVVHMVSYETPRRYYHCIVVFDEQMNLLRYSAPFKFDNKPIEYCLSILIDDDENVMMNYSSWDRTTRINIYDKHYIESLLIYK